MRRTLGLVAVCVGVGAILAGCGSSAQHVRSIEDVEGGSTRVLTVGVAKEGATEVPLALIEASLPKRFPEPLAQSFLAPAGVPLNCGTGLALTTVTLFDGRKLEYGPCQRPDEIEQLRRAMLGAYRSIRRPIPGAPAGTPMWLTEAIWRFAANRGDPQPERIEVRIGVVDRYGRTVDRVWIRGTFTVCCGVGLGQCPDNAPERVEQLIGFTIDPETRRTISASAQHG